MNFNANNAFEFSFGWGGSLLLCCAMLVTLHLS